MNNEFVSKFVLDFNERRLGNITQVSNPDLYQTNT